MKSNYLIAFSLSLLLHIVAIKFEMPLQAQLKPIKKNMLSLRIIKREKIAKHAQEKDFTREKRKDIQNKETSKDSLNDNTSKEVTDKHEKNTLLVKHIDKSKKIKKTHNIKRKVKPKKKNLLAKNITPKYEKKKVTNNTPSKQAIKNQKNMDLSIENTDKSKGFSKYKNINTGNSAKKVLSSGYLAGKNSFVKARAKHRIIPEYPRKSRRLGEEGVVIVKAFIDRNGKVTDTVILSSSGYDRLDNAALKAVKKAEFYPAESNGISITSSRKFLFRFILDNEQN